ncbi:amidohydrolase [bacterium]|nr:amidohydrolase [candidate division CSSED10-310 bacterium]
MKSDLVFYNGTIHGYNDPSVTAVAIAETKILTTGTDDAVLGTLKRCGQAVDLKGRSLLPGFVDSHGHFLSYALSLDRIRLDGCNSLEKALEIIAEHQRKVRPGEWIQGAGWEVNRWGGEFPTRHALDRVAPGNPVALRSKDGHTAWLNTRALTELGITAASPEPPGGKIPRLVENGSPAGILYEAAADRALSRIPRISNESLDAKMLRATSLLHGNGVTGIHDFEGRSAFQALQRLHRNHQLRLRVLKYFSDDELDAAIEFGVLSGYGDELLKIGGVKVYADGALGSRSAHMLDNYCGEPDNYGIVVTSAVQLANLAGKAAAAGITIAIHAIGDAAVRSSLNALEVAIRTEHAQPSATPALRHRLEHVQMVSEEDLLRFGHPRVAISVQPSHLLFDMEMADRLWGVERTERAYPYRSLMKSGALVVFGSDFPVDVPRPLTGIFSAVTRRRPDGHPGPAGWHPAERISLDDALQAYTLNPAILAGEEGRVGTITEGKLADLVVVSSDITTCPPQDILGIEVDMTVFAGEIVFERK